MLNSRTGRIIIAVGSLIGGLGLWYAAVELLDLQEYVLPPPGEVLDRLVDGVFGGSLVNHTYVTTREILAGFLAGSVLGIGLGVMIALNRWTELLIYPYVVAFNAVPTVAITPLIIVWFGTEFDSIVIIAALVSFFPLLVNTVRGLQTAPDERQLTFMRSLAATRWQTFRMVRVPAALPSIFSGLELAMVLSVVGAIVGEFLGADEGLGYYIVLSQSLLDAGGMFVAFVILAVIGVALAGVLRWAGRRIAFWAPIDRGVGA